MSRLVKVSLLAMNFMLLAACSATSPAVPSQPRQMVAFRDLYPIVTGYQESVVATIIRHAKAESELTIELTYKDNGRLADQMAQAIREQVPNQLRLKPCCDVDSGRANLQPNQVNINFYRD